MCRRRLKQGFSLLELIAGLAVLAILLVMAVPALRNFSDSNALDACSLDLIGAINATRSEAIRSGNRVTLAPQDCTDWSNGIVMFSGVSATGCINDGGVTVLQKRDLSAKRCKVTGNFPGYIAYVGSGASRKINGAFLAGHLTIEAPDNCGVGTRTITLNSFGRPRASTGGASC